MEVKLNVVLLNILCLIIVSGTSLVYAQHTNIIKAELDQETQTIQIQQEFTYLNSSPDTLRTLFFNDWAHAYSDKNTALAKRFAEDFKKSLHLAKEDERGSTQILGMADFEFRNLSFKRTKQKDLIEITLNSPLPPNQSLKIYFTYTVKLPPNRYTPYGYNSRGGFYLKDWYLTPAVYDGSWQLYSNKNLEDLYTGITNTNINFTYPAGLFLGTNFNEVNITTYPNKQVASLKGENRKSCDIILNFSNKFIKHVTPYLIVVTDIRSPKYDEVSQGISINRITRFIHENLGEFPYEQLLVSEIDFNKNPLYGLNQLPSFIRPYQEQFQFEMKFLKTAVLSYLRETLFMNPRKEQWVSDAIVNYLMINFVDTYYPDQKLLGKLSTIWPISSFNLAKMSFNDQYPFLYMLTARKNLDQRLTTPNDSLIKFNQKIANNYKAGLGLAYLAAYTSREEINKSIKEFYNSHKLQPVTPEDFKSSILSNTEKDVDWFFDTYVNTDKRIDFKIKKVNKSDDTLEVLLKNKSGTNVPISLFGLRNDTVVSNYWFSDITELDTVSIPNLQEDRLVLNYDQKIPEFNQRDNWKSLSGFFSSNKKFKLQFLKDAENPYYNQIFYMPVAGFNVYDGISPGLRFSNKTLLERPFIFTAAPSFALKERSLVGNAGLNYRKYLKKSGLYVMNFSLNASSFHFQTNSRYSTITPAVGLGWRPDDLISNERKSLVFRYVNVLRDIDPSLTIETDPDYSVFNVRYNHYNNGIINFFSWFMDAQYSTDFAKVALNFEYRKLFDNNRQLNLRFFAGKFLRNETNSDFFSFALDRPTDYLFDYNYLGRSEESGITSQQIIIAEGGFKSQLENPFANDWITTANASFNLWRWIELYGDLGYVRNRGMDPRFVYDSGVRLNLVTDYFELYFPLYSNNGWEIAQPDYDEKIRFIVTLSPRTLIGLFTRKWF
ncbi:metalloprotease [Muriicola sp. SD30]|uniref:metalloprotease n=1 Tax=Muriicola sp. SD30 TaxID=3240936 RepID=UPI00350E963A